MSPPFLMGAPFPVYGLSPLPVLIEFRPGDARIGGGLAPSNEIGDDLITTDGAPQQFWVTLIGEHLLEVTSLVVDGVGPGSPETYTVGVDADIEVVDDETIVFALRHCSVSLSVYDTTYVTSPGGVSNFVTYQRWSPIVGGPGAGGFTFNLWDAKHTTFTSPRWVRRDGPLPYELFTDGTPPEVEGGIQGTSVLANGFTDAIIPPSNWFGPNNGFGPPARGTIAMVVDLDSVAGGALATMTSTGATGSADIFVLGLSGGNVSASVSGGPSAPVNTPSIAIGTGVAAVVTRFSEGGTLQLSVNGSPFADCSVAMSSLLLGDEVTDTVEFGGFSGTTLAVATWTGPVSDTYALLFYKWARTRGWIP